MQHHRIRSLRASRFRAGELGVQGMSLYTHVENKDALLDGIVEAMTGEAQVPPAGDTDWRDALRQLAGEIRA